MAGKKQILLTTAQVREWRHEKHVLEMKMAGLQQKLDDLLRKLSAAEVFAPEAVAEAKNGFFGSDHTDEEEGDGEHESENETSIANVFVADMQTTGASLKVAQIRTRLSQLGFKEKIEEKPNYVYGLVYRLTKSGRLIRRGLKYRAAPETSSQEETGATGSGPATPQ